MTKRFMVNGIEVEAVPCGNGMWAGMPVSPMEAIMKILKGEVTLANLQVEEIIEGENSAQGPEPEVEETLDKAYDAGWDAGYSEGYEDGLADGREAGPEADPDQDDTYTIRQYREDEGLTRTQLADKLNISRRSLGRYEDDNRLASEFGL